MSSSWVPFPDHLAVFEHDDLVGGGESSTRVGATISTADFDVNFGNAAAQPGIRLTGYERRERVVEDEDLGLANQARAGRWTKR